MSAWGAQAKSCKSLLDRVERNDPSLTELFILPTKTFGGAEIDRLAVIFENGNNTHLKKLSASGHKLPNESLYKLGKAIAAGHTTTALTSLAIGDDSMGHTGILAFTKGLKECGGTTRLEEIDFSWKGIGTSGFEMILNSFDSTHCPQLRVLNLRRNENIGETVEGEYSFQPISHLEELDLSQCGLSGDFIETFFACLQQRDVETKLTKLHLQENELKAKGFLALLPLITKSSQLREINLSKCQIDDVAIQSLAKAAGNNNPQLLDISHNSITSDGVQSLSEGLKNPASPLFNLMELNLAGNNIGEEGVQVLAKALESRIQQNGPSSLEKLDLTNTNCGAKGAMDIISKGRLKCLYLFNNNLGSDGCMALAPTLKGGHGTLEQLDLGGNGANQAAVVLLLSSLLEKGSFEKSSLNVLVVGGNEGGDAVEQIAANVREVHPTLDIARDKKAQRQ